MQITYQKNNGCIMQKYRNTPLPYKIGDRTSMGWKVLNIEYLYNNKYYSKHEYDSIICKNKQKLIKRKQTVELCTKEIKNFLYCIIAVLVINFIKILLGI